MECTINFMVAYVKRLPTPATQCITYKQKTNYSKHGVPMDCSRECVENPECSANITMDTFIGKEQAWAKECLEVLQENELEDQHVTTDQYSRAHWAAQIVAGDLNLKTEPCSLIDTRHLTENHRKFIKFFENVLLIMFSKNKRTQVKICNRFANDMAEWCQAEINSASKKYPRDVNKLLSVLSNTCDAITEY